MVVSLLHFCVFTDWHPQIIQPVNVVFRPSLNLICLVSTGLVPKQQTKTLPNKDSKRGNHQPLPPPLPPIGMLPVAPAPQTQPQLFQPKPPFVSAPSVPPLDSSQLLSSGFDPLAHFMNSHLTESNAESGAAVATAGAALPPGLLNANAPLNQTPTDTHPFLNQHPIVPSPGWYFETAA